MEQLHKLIENRATAITSNTAQKAPTNPAAGKQP